MHYKVVELKKGGMLSRRMKAADLEQKLNQEAEGGWVLDQILDGETFGFVTGSKDVLLMIFREVSPT